MPSLAPLTKLILTLACAGYALGTQNIVMLGIVTVVILAIFLGLGLIKKYYRGILVLVLCASFLVILQLLFNTKLIDTMNAALRMLIMALSVMLLIITTKPQELTTALVKQCKLSYTYAFMVTAVLRFVPDLLTECKAIEEAQRCRGYDSNEGIGKKVTSYVAIVKPLVFRAITRSEHMALGLELRGFGSKNRTFITDVSLKKLDYIMLGSLVAVCILN